jgi:hypothetical protein
MFVFGLWLAVGISPLLIFFSASKFLMGVLVTLTANSCIRVAMTVSTSFLFECRSF